MSTQRRKGLTLIELTVTVGVLCVVVGQGLSASGEARTAARKMRCAQRLGDIAHAAHAYAAQDANELVLPIGIADALNNTAFHTTYYGFGGKSGTGAALDIFASPYSAAQLMNADYRPLNYIISKHPLPVLDPWNPDWGDMYEDARLKLDVYHCPGDQGFPGMHIQGWKWRGISSYNYFGTSYIPNPMYIQQLGSNVIYSNGLRGRPASAIPNPQNTIMYWENAALYAILATNPELDQSGCYWPYTIGNFTANGWHDEPFHFNVAMADGSVAFRNMRGFGWPEVLPDFPASCPAFACRCYVVRGLDWQLDTFPAAPNATNKRAPIGSGGIVTQLGFGSEFTIVNN
jgi:hypothetical protein